MKSIFYYILVVILLVSCTEGNHDAADEMNRQAYAFRYINIDSTIHYAHEAYRLSKDYNEGRMEALGNMAFAEYQQMRFEKSIKLLDSINNHTHNQIELLCSDVMRMKISQRTGDLRQFYRSWFSAQRRLSRISEEQESLNEHQLQLVLYASSEMHIIASTYYYYIGKDSTSRHEMEIVRDIPKLENDTAQWLNYMYMMGSGGMFTGDSLQIVRDEFDALLRTYSRAVRCGNKYFEANALQSLAMAVSTPEKREIVKNERSGGYQYLMNQHEQWMGGLYDNLLPYALARHAMQLFTEYKDVFQCAAVMRTLGEQYFSEGCYQDALGCFLEARRIADEQHQRSKLRVATWESGIEEKLSLTYSALGERQLASQHRNAYLDLLDDMRQDLEIEARADEISNANQHLIIMLAIVIVLFLLLLFTFWELRRQFRRKSNLANTAIREQMTDVTDETSSMKMRLEKERNENIVRRAKVSFLETILPLIDRLPASARRLEKEPDNDGIVEYIGELTTEIMRQNEFLTRWIQVRQGIVSMKVTSFAIQEILDTVNLSRSSYERQGLKLLVPKTEACVKADKILTLFMINTLCDNARKFTPSGGSVSILVDERDEYVELSVRDTGCGMSEEDVETLNHSKVYDASKLGLQSRDQDGGNISDKKGFGFGLMNCRGIIGQMKKMSTRFSCCDFGVESELGKGSRFWFRLPKALKMLLFIFMLSLCSHLSAQDSTPSTLSSHLSTPNSIVTANIEGRYEDALAIGDSILREKNIPDTTRMNVYNEMAIASQSLRLWNHYKRYNSECLKLHRKVTQDPDIEKYAAVIQSKSTDGQVVLTITLLLVVAVVIAFIIMVRGARSHRTESMELEDILEEKREQLEKVRYEFNKIYIQNQVLDNCLSTVKHETMYYPARIQQLVQTAREDTPQLLQLTQYYQQVYKLLLAQAQRQTDVRIHIDEQIIKFLYTNIEDALSAVCPDVGEIKREETENGNLVNVKIWAEGRTIPENLFTTQEPVFPALVARQIVRLLDAEKGHPGLRLSVENNIINISLCKNLK